MVTREKGSSNQAGHPRYHPDEQYDLPPAYSTTLDSSAPTGGPLSTARVVPGVPNIQFKAYTPPNSSASSDRSIITIVDTTLCKSPMALARLIEEQIALPPIPEIRITGMQNSMGEGASFDIRLNMMRYFLPSDGQPGLTYTKLISCGKSKARASNFEDADEVEKWARIFCKDKSNEKM